jgi:O-methyltransferase involved in polyketide biosynthesis
MKIALNDHEASMLLPLLGRALESKKNNPVFVDPLAVSAIDNIEYDFAKLEKQISEYSSISWSVRAMKFSRIAAEFIQSHPEAMIVNMGAGLDTTFYIVDNGKINWVNIDSEKVNELRVSLFPANERVVNVNGNVLDPELIQGLANNNPNVLIIASGLLMYFPEEDIRELFNRIADTFPAALVAFDRISAYAIQYVQSDLNKINLNNAKIQWGIDNVREIEMWDSRFRVVKEERMFEGIDRKTIQSKDIVKIMDMNDQYNGSGIVVLRFGPQTTDQQGR